MDIFQYAFLIIILGLTLYNIFRSVRAFVVSRKARTVKVMISPAVIINAVFCAVFVGIAINRFLAAESYRAKARMYEQILGIGGGITGSSDGYQELAGSASDTRAKLEEAVAALNKNADSVSTLAWYSLAVGIFDFTAGFGTLWYFTEEGLVTSGYKLPEPITAICKDGRIELYLKARLANNRKLVSFKATPKNMAVFGRFIEQGSPEIKISEQVSPPNNSNMLT